MYTYQVRLVGSRCLLETTIEVEPIDRVYLPNLSYLGSQLALFELDNP
jgi:hypothetical protein